MEYWEFCHNAACSATAPNGADGLFPSDFGGEVDAGARHIGATPARPAWDDGGSVALPAEEARRRSTEGRNSGAADQALFV